MLLPIASLFSACGNDGYNLNNLQNDFNTIQTENENIKYSDGKFVFDYSKHANLNAVVEYTYPYTQLKEYNKVYENLMAFTFDYIDECSNNSSIDNAKTKDSIKKDLDALKKAIHDVDNYVNMLAEIINVSYNDDIFTNACLSRYENLLVSYSELFKCTTNFNNSLADLYFNHVLVDGNPNVFEMGSSNFDVNKVVNIFDARLKYQMSNLSQCFVEMYIDGNLADQMANAEEYFDLTQYNYEDNIEAISLSFDEQVASEKANNASNKQRFYELSVQAYNIQAALKNDDSKFIHACNKIAYASINLSEASAEEKMCVEIIDYRYELVSTYNEVLAEMLNITGV